MIRKRRKDLFALMDDEMDEIIEELGLVSDEEDDDEHSSDSDNESGSDEDSDSKYEKDVMSKKSVIWDEYYTVQKYGLSLLIIA